MENEYQWQGEPAIAEFGTCLVRRKEETPMWWHNYECRETGRAALPAIRVTASYGESFLIANHYGIGVNKLRNGGWPRHTHFTMEGEFVPDTEPYAFQRTFDQVGFEQHEAAREEWQRDNFPEDWKRVKALQQKILRLTEL